MSAVDVAFHQVMKPNLIIVLLLLNPEKQVIDHHAGLRNQLIKLLGQVFGFYEFLFYCCLCTGRIADCLSSP